MPRIRLSARVKKVGNSLALFIPAAAARRAGLSEGQTVEATLETSVPSPAGLLADVPYEPFDRRGLWRERL